MLETTNVTHIPKGPPSSSVANYQLIYITSALHKVFQRLVSVRLGQFMERSGVLPTTQVAYRKGLDACEALLCMSHTLRSAWESGQEARIVQIDFSAAFDIGSTIGGIWFCGHWRYCVANVDTVSIISMTACYGELLSEQTG